MASSPSPPPCPCATALYVGQADTDRLQEEKRGEIGFFQLLDRDGKDRQRAGATASEDDNVEAVGVDITNFLLSALPERAGDGFASELAPSGEASKIVKEALEQLRPHKGQLQKLSNSTHRAVASARPSIYPSLAALGGEPDAEMQYWQSLDLQLKTARPVALDDGDKSIATLAEGDDKIELGCLTLHGFEALNILASQQFEKTATFVPLYPPWQSPNAAKAAVLRALLARDGEDTGNEGDLGGATSTRVPLPLLATLKRDAADATKPSPSSSAPIRCDLHEQLSSNRVSAWSADGRYLVVLTQEKPLCVTDREVEALTAKGEEGPSSPPYQQVSRHVAARPWETTLQVFDVSSSTLLGKTVAPTARTVLLLSTALQASSSPQQQTAIREPKDGHGDSSFSYSASPTTSLSSLLATWSHVSSSMLGDGRRVHSMRVLTTEVVSCSVPPDLPYSPSSSSSSSPASVANRPLPLATVFVCCLTVAVVTRERTLSFFRVSFPVSSPGEAGSTQAAMRSTHEDDEGKPPVVAESVVVRQASASVPWRGIGVPEEPAKADLFLGCAAVAKRELQERQQRSTVGENAASTPLPQRPSVAGSYALRCARLLKEGIPVSDYHGVSAVLLGGGGAGGFCCADLRPFVSRIDSVDLFASLPAAVLAIAGLLLSSSSSSSSSSSLSGEGRLGLGTYSEENAASITALRSRRGAEAGAGTGRTNGIAAPASSAVGQSGFLHEENTGGVDVGAVDSLHEEARPGVILIRLQPADSASSSMQAVVCGRATMGSGDNDATSDEACSPPNAGATDGFSVPSLSLSGSPAQERSRAVDLAGSDAQALPPFPSSSVSPSLHPSLLFNAAQAGLLTALAAAHGTFPPPASPAAADELALALIACFLQPFASAFLACAASYHESALDEQPSGAGSIADIIAASSSALPLDFRALKHLGGRVLQQTPRGMAKLLAALFVPTAIGAAAKQKAVSGSEGPSSALNSWVVSSADHLRFVADSVARKTGFFFPSLQAVELAVTALLVESSLGKALEEGYLREVEGIAPKARAERKGEEDSEADKSSSLLSSVGSLFSSISRATCGACGSAVRRCKRRCRRQAQSGDIASAGLSGEDGEEAAHEERIAALTAILRRCPASRAFTPDPGNNSPLLSPDFCNRLQATLQFEAATIMSKAHADGDGPGSPDEEGSLALSKIAASAVVQAAEAAFHYSACVKACLSSSLLCGAARKSDTKIVLAMARPGIAAQPVSRVSSFAVVPLAGSQGNTLTALSFLFGNQLCAWSVQGSAAAHGSGAAAADVHSNFAEDEEEEARAAFPSLSIKPVGAPAAGVSLSAVSDYRWVGTRLAFVGLGDEQGGGRFVAQLLLIPRSASSFGFAVEFVAKEEGLMKATEIATGLPAASSFGLRLVQQMQNGSEDVLTVALLPFVPFPRAVASSSDSPALLLSGAIRLQEKLMESASLEVLGFITSSQRPALSDGAAAAATFPSQPASASSSLEDLLSSELGEITSTEQGPADAAPAVHKATGDKKQSADGRSYLSEEADIGALKRQLLALAEAVLPQCASLSARASPFPARALDVPDRSVAAPSSNRCPCLRLQAFVPLRFLEDRLLPPEEGGAGAGQSAWEAEEPGLGGKSLLHLLRHGENQKLSIPLHPALLDLFSKSTGSFDSRASSVAGAPSLPLVVQLVFERAGSESLSKKAFTSLASVTAEEEDKALRVLIDEVFSSASGRMVLDASALSQYASGKAFELLLLARLWLSISNVDSSDEAAPAFFSAAKVIKTLGFLFDRATTLLATVDNQVSGDANASAEEEQYRVAWATSALHFLVGEVLSQLSMPSSSHPVVTRLLQTTPLPFIASTSQKDGAPFVPLDIAALESLLFVGEKALRLLLGDDEYACSASANGSNQGRRQEEEEELSRIYRDAARLLQESQRRLRWYQLLLALRAEEKNEGIRARHQLLEMATKGPGAASFFRKGKNTENRDESEGKSEEASSASGKQGHREDEAGSSAWDQPWDEVESLDEDAHKDDVVGEGSGAVGKVQTATKADASSVEDAAATPPQSIPRLVNASALFEAEEWQSLNALSPSMPSFLCLFLQRFVLLASSDEAASEASLTVHSRTSLACSLLQATTEHQGELLPYGLSIMTAFCSLEQGAGSGTAQSADGDDDDDEEEDENAEADRRSQESDVLTDDFGHRELGARRKAAADRSFAEQEKMQRRAQVASAVSEVASTLLRLSPLVTSVSTSSEQAASRLRGQIAAVWRSLRGAMNAQQDQQTARQHAETMKSLRNFLSLPEHGIAPDALPFTTAAQSSVPGGSSSLSSSALAPTTATMAPAVQASLSLVVAVLQSAPLATQLPGPAQAPKASNGAASPSLSSATLLSLCVSPITIAGWFIARAIAVFAGGPSSVDRAAEELSIAKAVMNAAAADSECDSGRKHLCEIALSLVQFAERKVLIASHSGSVSSSSAFNGSAPASPLLSPSPSSPSPSASTAWLWASEFLLLQDQLRPLLSSDDIDGLEPAAAAAGDHTHSLDAWLERVCEVLSRGVQLSSSAAGAGDNLNHEAREALLLFLDQLVGRIAGPRGASPASSSAASLPVPLVVLSSSYRASMTALERFSRLLQCWSSAGVLPSRGTVASSSLPLLLSQLLGTLASASAVNVHADRGVPARLMATLVLKAAYASPFASCDEAAASAVSRLASLASNLLEKLRNVEESAQAYENEGDALPVDFNEASSVERWLCSLPSVVAQASSVARDSVAPLSVLSTALQRLVGSVIPAAKVLWRCIPQLWSESLEGSQSQSLAAYSFPLQPDAADRKRGVSAYPLRFQQLHRALPLYAPLVSLLAATGSASTKSLDQDRQRMEVLASRLLSSLTVRRLWLASRAAAATTVIRDERTATRNRDRSVSWGSSASEQAAARRNPRYDSLQEEEEEKHDEDERGEDNDDDGSASVASSASSSVVSLRAATAAAAKAVASTSSKAAGSVLKSVIGLSRAAAVAASAEPEAATAAGPSGSAFSQALSAARAVREMALATAKEAAAGGARKTPGVYRARTRGQEEEPLPLLFLEDGEDDDSGNDEDDSEADSNASTAGRFLALSATDVFATKEAADHLRTVPAFSLCCFGRSLARSYEGGGLCSSSSAAAASPAGGRALSLSRFAQRRKTKEQMEAAVESAGDESALFAEGLLSALCSAFVAVPSEKSRRSFFGATGAFGAVLLRDSVPSARTGSLDSSKGLVALPLPLVWSRELSDLCSLVTTHLDSHPEVQPSLLPAFIRPLVKNVVLDFPLPLAQLSRLSSSLTMSGEDTARKEQQLKLSRRLAALAKDMQTLRQLMSSGLGNAVDEDLLRDLTLISAVVELLCGLNSKGDTRGIGESSRFARLSREGWKKVSAGLAEETAPSALTSARIPLGAILEQLSAFEGDSGSALDSLRRLCFSGPAAPFFLRRLLLAPQELAKLCHPFALPFSLQTHAEATRTILPPASGAQEEPDAALPSSADFLLGRLLQGTEQFQTAAGKTVRFAGAEETTEYHKASPATPAKAGVSAAPVRPGIATHLAAQTQASPDAPLIGPVRMFAAAFSALSQAAEALAATNTPYTPYPQKRSRIPRTAARGNDREDEGGGEGDGDSEWDGSTWATSGKRTAGSLLGNSGLHFNAFTASTPGRDDEDGDVYAGTPAANGAPSAASTLRQQAASQQVLALLSYEETLQEGQDERQRGAQTGHLSAAHRAAVDPTATHLFPFVRAVLAVVAPETAAADLERRAAFLVAALFAEACGSAFASLMADDESTLMAIPLLESGIALLPFLIRDVSAGTQGSEETTALVFGLASDFVRKAFSGNELLPQHSLSSSAAADLSFVSQWLIGQQLSKSDAGGSVLLRLFARLYASSSSQAASATSASLFPPSSLEAEARRLIRASASMVAAESSSASSLVESLTSALAAACSHVAAGALSKLAVLVCGQEDESNGLLRETTLSHVGASLQPCWESAVRLLLAYRYAASDLTSGTSSSQEDLLAAIQAALQSAAERANGQLSLLMEPALWMCLELQRRTNGPAGSNNSGKGLWDLTDAELLMSFDAEDASAASQKGLLHSIYVRSLLAPAAESASGATPLQPALASAGPSPLLSAHTTAPSSPAPLALSQTSTPASTNAALVNGAEKIGREAGAAALSLLSVETVNLASPDASVPSAAALKPFLARLVSLERALVGGTSDSSLSWQDRLRLSAGGGFVASFIATLPLSSSAATAHVAASFVEAIVFPVESASPASPASLDLDQGRRRAAWFSHLCQLSLCHTSTDSAAPVLVALLRQSGKLKAAFELLEEQGKAVKEVLTAPAAGSSAAASGAALWLQLRPFISLAASADAAEDVAEEPFSPSALCCHLASTLAGADGTKEAKEIAAILNWLATSVLEASTCRSDAAITTTVASSVAKVAKTVLPAIQSSRLSLYQALGLAAPKEIKAGPLIEAVLSAAVSSVLHQPGTASADTVSRGAVQLIAKLPPPALQRFTCQVSVSLRPPSASADAEAELEVRGLLLKSTLDAAAAAASKLKAPDAAPSSVSAGQVKLMDSLVALCRLEIEAISLRQRLQGLSLSSSRGLPEKPLALLSEAADAAPAAASLTGSSVLTLAAPAFVSFIEAVIASARARLSGSSPAQCSLKEVAKEVLLSSRGDAEAATAALMALWSLWEVTVPLSSAPCLCPALLRDADAGSGDGIKTVFVFALLHALLVDRFLPLLEERPSSLDRAVVSFPRLSSLLDAFATFVRSSASTTTPSPDAMANSEALLEVLKPAARSESEDDEDDTAVASAAARPPPLSLFARVADLSRALGEESDELLSSPAAPLSASQDARGRMKEAIALCIRVVRSAASASSPVVLLSNVLAPFAACAGIALSASEQLQLDAARGLQLALLSFLRDQPIPLASEAQLMIRDHHKIKEALLGTTAAANDEESAAATSAEESGLLSELSTASAPVARGHRKGKLWMWGGTSEGDQSKVRPLSSAAACDVLLPRPSDLVSAESRSRYFHRLLTGSVGTGAKEKGLLSSPSAAALASMGRELASAFRNSLAPSSSSSAATPEAEDDTPDEGDGSFVVLPSSKDVLILALCSASRALVLHRAFLAPASNGGPLRLSSGQQDNCRSSLAAMLLEALELAIQQTRSSGGVRARIALSLIVRALMHLLLDVDGRSAALADVRLPSACSLTHEWQPLLPTAPSSKNSQGPSEEEDEDADTRLEKAAIRLLVLTTSLEKRPAVGRLSAAATEMVKQGVERAFRDALSPLKGSGQRANYVPNTPQNRDGLVLSRLLFHALFFATLGSEQDAATVASATALLSSWCRHPAVSAIIPLGFAVSPTAVERAMAAMKNSRVGVAKSFFPREENAVSSMQSLLPPSSAVEDVDVDDEGSVYTSEGQQAIQRAVKMLTQFSCDGDRFIEELLHQLERLEQHSRGSSSPSPLSAIIAELAREASRSSASWPLFKIAAHFATTASSSASLNVAKTVSATAGAAGKTAPKAASPSTVMIPQQVASAIIRLRASRERNFGSALHGTSDRDSLLVSCWASALVVKRRLQALIAEAGPSRLEEGHRALLLAGLSACDSFLALLDTEGGSAGGSGDDEEVRSREPREAAGAAESFDWPEEHDEEDEAAAKPEQKQPHKAKNHTNRDDEDVDQDEDDDSDGLLRFPSSAANATKAASALLGGLFGNVAAAVEASASGSGSSGAFSGGFGFLQKAQQAVASAAKNAATQVAAVTAATAAAAAAQREAALEEEEEEGEDEERSEHEKEKERAGRRKDTPGHAWQQWGDEERDDADDEGDNTSADVASSLLPMRGPVSSSLFSFAKKAVSLVQQQAKDVIAASAPESSPPPLREEKDDNDEQATQFPAPSSRERSEPATAQPAATGWDDWEDEDQREEEQEAKEVVAAGRAAAAPLSVPAAASLATESTAAEPSSGWGWGNDEKDEEDDNLAKEEDKEESKPSSSSNAPQPPPQPALVSLRPVHEDTGAGWAIEEDLDLGLPVEAEEEKEVEPFAPQPLQERREEDDRQAAAKEAEEASDDGVALVEADEEGALPPLATLEIVEGDAGDGDDEQQQQSATPMMPSAAAASSEAANDGAQPPAESAAFSSLAEAEQVLSGMLADVEECWGDESETTSTSQAVPPSAPSSALQSRVSSAPLPALQESAAEENAEGDRDESTDDDQDSDDDTSDSSFEEDQQKQQSDEDGDSPPDSDDDTHDEVFEEEEQQEDRGEQGEKDEELVPLTIEVGGLASEGPVEGTAEVEAEKEKETEEEEVMSAKEAERFVQGMVDEIDLDDFGWGAGSSSGSYDDEHRHQQLQAKDTKKPESPPRPSPPLSKLSPPSFVATSAIEHRSIAGGSGSPAKRHAALTSPASTAKHAMSQATIMDPLTASRLALMSEEVSAARFSLTHRHGHSHGHSHSHSHGHSHGHGQGASPGHGHGPYQHQHQHGPGCTHGHHDHHDHHGHGHSPAPVSGSPRLPEPQFAKKITIERDAPPGIPPFHSPAAASGSAPAVGSPSGSGVSPTEEARLLSLSASLSRRYESPNKRFDSPIATPLMAVPKAVEVAEERAAGEELKPEDEDKEEASAVPVVLAPAPLAGEEAPAAVSLTSEASLPMEEQKESADSVENLRPTAQSPAAASQEEMPSSGWGDIDIDLGESELGAADAAEVRAEPKAADGAAPLPPPPKEEEEEEEEEPSFSFSLGVLADTADGVDSLAPISNGDEAPALLAGVDSADLFSSADFALALSDLVGGGGGEEPSAAATKLPGPNPAVAPYISSSASQTSSSSAAFFVAPRLSPSAVSSSLSPAAGISTGQKSSGQGSNAEGGAQFSPPLFVVPSFSSPAGITAGGLSSGPLSSASSGLFGASASHAATSSDGSAGAGAGSVAANDDDDDFPALDGLLASFVGDADSDHRSPASRGV